MALWPAQILMVCLRAVFRVQEFFATGTRKAKLRNLRSKMEAVQHDRDAAIAKIQSGDFLSGMETMEAMKDRMGYRTSEGERTERREWIEKFRASKQETEMLKSIHTEAGDDLEQAEVRYREYVAEHPQSRNGIRFLGGILLQRGDYEGSLTAYREALRLSADDPLEQYSAHSAIGAALHAKGESEAALAEYRKIIDADKLGEPLVWLAYYRYGIILNEMGRRNEAREAWKKVPRSKGTKALTDKIRKLLAENPAQ